MKANHQHIQIFQKLGIKTNGRDYEECVDDLLHMFHDLEIQIEQGNKERFSQELYRITKTVTN